MNEKMRRSLQKTLRAGEEVRWESGTRKFRILEGKEGRGILLRWIFSTLIIGGLLVAFSAGGGMGAGFYVVMLVIYAMLMLSPVLAYRELTGQRYFITNQRAMSIRADGSVYAMEFADMGVCRLYPLDFGGAALALGKVLLEEKDKQLRWRATHPDESADSSGITAVRGLVFYRAERAEEAMRLLSAVAKEA